MEETTVLSLAVDGGSLDRTGDCGEEEEGAFSEGKASGTCRCTRQDVCLRPGPMLGPGCP